MKTHHYNQTGITAFTLMFFLFSFGFAIIFVGSLMLARDGMMGSRRSAAAAFSAAESGAEIGVRAVCDDIVAAQSESPAAPGYSLSASLDPDGPVAAVGGQGSPDRVRQYENTDDGAYPLRMAGEMVEVSGFHQAYNMIGSRIAGAAVGINCRRLSETGPAPHLMIEYAAGESRDWVPLAEYTVSHAGFAMSYHPLPGTVGWKEIVGRDGDGIRLRARVCGEQGGVMIDYICLKTTAGVDTLAEPWRTRQYVALPLSFAGSRITDISIEDESGKVNINAASLPLLKGLFVEYGVPDDKAAAIAAAIIMVRTANIFRSADSLHGVEGVTDELFGLSVEDPSYGMRRLRNDLTVFSWINSRAVRSPGLQAPVNINTASAAVLRAVLRPIIPGADVYGRLASAIVARRAVQPFGVLYSTDPDCSDHCFYAFLKLQDYLTENDVRAIMENADLSPKRWTGGDTQTAGFSFFSNSFMVSAAGEYPSGGIPCRRAVRVLAGSPYDHAMLAAPRRVSLKLPVVPTDVEQTGYWREE